MDSNICFWTENLLQQYHHHQNVLQTSAISSSSKSTAERESTAAILDRIIKKFYKLSKPDPNKTRQHKRANKTQNQTDQGKRDEIIIKKLFLFPIMKRH